MNESIAGLSRRSLMLTTALAAGCVLRSFKPATLESLQSGEGTKSSYRVRVWTIDGTRHEGSLVSVDRHGITVDEGEASVTVPADEIDSIYLGKVDALASVALTTGAVVGIAQLVLFVLVVIAIATKSSCPFVYVVGRDGKRRLVGEAYSGANAKIAARADKVPLPAVEGDEVHVVLADEAHETQFTDQAVLEVVDRPAGGRVRTTPDAQLIHLSDAMPPEHVEDLTGRDVTAIVLADDEAWMTDMDEARRREVAPVAEGLVARFASVPEAATLDLVLQNSAWLDVLNRQYWLSFGKRPYEKMLARGRDEKRAPRRLEAYREAGIHVRVEVRQGDEDWRHVAWIPPVGFVAPRPLALELPGVRPGEPVDVRLSGGVGFLMVHQMGLGRLLSRPASVRVAPHTAIASDGADERARLASVDGDAQVLPDKGTEVSLRFSLPEQAEGTEREVFLHTHGYYELHPSDEAKLRLNVVLPLNREPERFSEFSLATWAAIADQVEDEGIVFAR